MRYVLHLSTDISGFGRPTIPAVTAAFCGTIDPDTGNLVKPDIVAVRDTLPYRYRKAFDRRPQGWVNDAGIVQWNLDDRRGKCLNTLYATPLKA